MISHSLVARFLILWEIFGWDFRCNSSTIILLAHHGAKNVLPFYFAVLRCHIPYFRRNLQWKKSIFCVLCSKMEELSNQKRNSRSIRHCESCLDRDSRLKILNGAFTAHLALCDFFCFLKWEKWLLVAFSGFCRYFHAVFSRNHRKC